MSTIVLTSEFILADRRLNMNMDIIDCQGEKVSLHGTTDDYCKLASVDLKDANGVPIHTVAVFGAVDVAKRLLKLATITGLDKLGAVLENIHSLYPNTPDVESGFAWIDNGGVRHYAYVNKDSWEIGYNDKEPVVFGSGRPYFNCIRQEYPDYSVEKAFHRATAIDPSSSVNFDRWTRSGLKLELDLKPTVDTETT